MSFRKIMSAALAAALLTACAGSPPPPASPQPEPELAAVEKRVKRYLDESLKDPYSVRDLEISPVMRGSVWTGLVNYGEAASWSSCVRYNAKNSYGAYVGRRSYRYHLLDNGRLWIVPSC